MRRQAVLGLALILAAAAGCRTQCFLTECDADHYLHDLQLPQNLECDPAPAIQSADGPPPVTVDNPDRQARYLTLAEAIALALEHGTPGSRALNGTTDDTLVSFQGGFGASPDTPIRVLAIDPAVLGSDIDMSLAKFDAIWNTSMVWQNIDEPLGGNFLNSFNNGERAQFQSGLLKPLATGGVAGITFNTQYTLLSTPPLGVSNPGYRPSLQFTFEQPLLQAFGVEINQLRTTHPGPFVGNNAASGLLSGLSTPPSFPSSQGNVPPGILITRVRFDQQRAQFESQVHTLLTNVEVAYWNLYGAYWNLYSREVALSQAYSAWRINRVRFNAGIVPVAQLAQVRGQYESFRGQRLDALGQVLQAEHQMRGLLGLPVEDGCRLIPIEAPTLAPYKPDWPTAVHEALSLRPELLIAREELKFRQLDVINEKNLLLPDLRLITNYNVNGFGTHLDGGGSDPNNAFHSLASNQFNDWGVGLNLSVPIGFRDAHARVRAARLRLGQGYLTLQDQENKTRRYLDEQYRALIQSYQQIEAQRAQREAQAIQLRARFREYVAGKGVSDPTTGQTILDRLLEAQRFWADALRGEYAAIVDYNNALARFEYAKGTIMQHDNVIISEGGLPQCAQVRAVEHERQRSHALVLRERAAPVNHPECSTPEGVVPGLPELPVASAPSLPALFAGRSQSIHSPDEQQAAVNSDGQVAGGAAPGWVALGRPQASPLFAGGKNLFPDRPTSGPVPSVQPIIQAAWRPVNHPPAPAGLPPTAGLGNPISAPNAH